MRRNRNKNNVDIDLTSMLDVIFILLMAVLISASLNNKSEVEWLRDTVSDLRVVASENEAEKNAYKSENTALKEEIKHLTIYAVYNANEPSEREFRVITASENEVTFDVRPENASESFAELENVIVDVLRTNAEFEDEARKPVMVLVDTKNILYRDAVDIKAMLDRLKTEYEDLYVR